MFHPLGVDVSTKFTRAWQVCRKGDLHPSPLSFYPLIFLKCDVGECIMVVLCNEYMLFQEQLDHLNLYTANENII